MTTSTSDRDLLSRASELAEVYGSKLERWPESDQAQLRARMDASAEFGRALQAKLEQAAALDRALADAPTLEPSSDLLRRVRSIPLEHSSKPSWLSWFGLEDAKLGRWSAWGLAAALVLGIVTGVLSPPAEDDTTDLGQEANVMAFGDPMGEEMDL